MKTPQPLLHPDPKALRTRIGISAIIALSVMTFFPPDLPAQSIVGSISRPGLQPTALDVYEAGDRLFISDADAGSVYIYDGTTLAEVGSYELGEGFSLTLDSVRGRVYLSGSDSGRIAVLDALTGDYLHDVPGTFPDASVRIDVSGGKLYVFTSFEGLSQIDIATEVATPVVSDAITFVHWLPPQDVAVNPVTHEVYLVRNTVDLCELVVVNGTTLETTVVPDFGFPAGGFGLNWRENKLYACSLGGVGSPTQVLDRDTGVITEIYTDNDAQAFFLNPTSNRLYSSSEVNCISSVIDGATDAVFNLPMFNASQVAFRESTGHVYFAGEDGDQAWRFGVFDERTQMLEVFSREVPTTHSYPAMAVNQTTGRVFAMQSSTEDTIAVLQDSARLDRPPVFLGTTDDWGGSVFALDSEAKQVVGGLDSSYYQKGDHALAVRPGGGRLYVPSYVTPVGEDLGVMAIHAGIGQASGSVGGSILQDTKCSTGGSSPLAVAVTPDGSRAYVTNSDWTNNWVHAPNVGVIDLSSNSLLTTVTAGTNPWGIAITPDGAAVYVTNRGSNDVSAIDTTTNVVVATIPVGTTPWGIAINPAGTKAFVVNSAANTVSVIETASNEVTATIPVGTTPHWVAVAPDGSHVFVSNRSDGTVSVIDAATDTVVQTVTVGAEPEGVAALPDGSEVWVANSAVSGTSTLSVIDIGDFSVTTIADLPAGSFGESLGAYSLTVADPSAKIAGRVTQGTLPIAGALVRALQSGAAIGIATTNAAGDYAIFDLAPGAYDVEASIPEESAQTVTGRTVAAGCTLVAHFNWEPDAVAPAITSQPMNQVLTSGQDAAFAATATGYPAPAFHWQVSADAGAHWEELTEAAPYSGVATSTLAVSEVSMAMSGLWFRCVVSNGVSPDATSDPAELTVTKATATVVLGGLSQIYDGTSKPVTTTTTPVGLTVVITYDGSATAPTNAGTYDVVATIDDPDYAGSATGTLDVAKAALTAQADDKSKNQGEPNPALTISYTGFVHGETIGVVDQPPTVSTTATTESPPGTYPITLSGGSDDNYSIARVNGLLTVISAVVPADGTHAVVVGGYVAGATVTITNMVTYTGNLSALGWQVILPDGWSFASSDGADGDVGPEPGTTAVLEWAWTTIPASPVTFTYTLNVPEGATDAESVSALVVGRQEGAPFEALVLPDPLLIGPAPLHHSADTSQDGRIGLVELLRVIELYNYRSGTTRTGEYTAQAGTEDGYVPGPAGDALTAYHSADTDRNGRLSLIELLRVIELYNHRSGTVRTGEYHVEAGTEDGFAPGP